VARMSQAQPYVAGYPKRRRTKDEVDGVRDAIERLLKADHPQTVRQVFYQLVVQGHIEKTEVEYGRTVVRPRLSATAIPTLANSRGTASNLMHCPVENYGAWLRNASSGTSLPCSSRHCAKPRSRSGRALKHLPLRRLTRCEENGEAWGDKDGARMQGYRTLVPHVPRLSIWNVYTHARLTHTIRRYGKLAAHVAPTRKT
jgi:hypothetical protein